MEIPALGEKIEVDGLTYRWANPSDTEAFVKWATGNNKIPHKDILASMHLNNPTCVFFVVEKDGVPILFAPFYFQMNLAFLGFNPDAGRRDRMNALAKMQEISTQWAQNYGVQELVVSTSKDYPVGRWALQNGFEPEPRETFKLRITPLIDPEVEAHYKE